ncbi:MAG: hypothetical protein QNJ98_00820 [Planctomycetota bacterium]|nr:hypothetical protein [Planctomycetota bacterium]
MKGGLRMEACRSQAELRAAYADAMAKQVADGPQDLAGLRARFRRRSRELSRGFGSAIEGRAAWILACLESSLPDATLEAELLRLSADDPKLDLARLRQVLAAREEWREARSDPRVPPVVLHVLETRLGVPPRARAMAQDVAEPRRVAQYVEDNYPLVYALDPQMFRRIKGMPAQPSRRSATTAAARVEEKKRGRRSFWIAIFSIWLVAKLLGLAVDGVKGPEPAKPGAGLESTGVLEGESLGDAYDRIVRHLVAVNALRQEVRRASEEAQRDRAISLVRHQRLREHIAEIRYGVKELVYAKARHIGDPEFPALDDLAELLVACEKAAERLDRKRMQVITERGRGPGGEAGR